MYSFPLKYPICRDLTLESRWRKNYRKNFYIVMNYNDHVKTDNWYLSEKVGNYKLTLKSLDNIYKI